jgi:hypothetical protein
MIKVAVEYALTELRMAHQSQDKFKALDNINAAWKTATSDVCSRRTRSSEETTRKLLKVTMLKTLNRRSKIVAITTLYI